MTKRFALAMSVLAISAISVVANAAPRRHHRPRPPVEQCPTDCGVKVDHAPWRIASDQPVTGVCIKAGRQLFSFTSDGSNGCFFVTGLGTTHVTVRRERGEHECEDISSVVFYHGCGSGGGGGGTDPGGNLPG